MTSLALSAVTFLFLPAPGEPPVCDAGGPYLAECNGVLASVQLDGTGSYDPGGKPLRFKWQIECGAGYLDDPNSPTPTLYHPMTACAVACGRVDLIVSSKSGKSTCGTEVEIDDTTPPLITCPPEASILTGDPYDPSITGFATAVDACNAAPVITWTDASFPGSLPEVTVVVRTWTADDGCQASTCEQTITIAPFAVPHVDLRPGECPNPFFVSGRASAPGSVPASVLGNAFDPTLVDPGSVRLSTLVPLDGGSVDFIQPLQISIGDAGTPFVGDLCDCHALGPDGILDLNLRFSEQQMAFGLGLGNEPIGSEVPLVISGLFLDGTPFSGVDCVLIQ
jgi:hypothetical protein